MRSGDKRPASPRDMTFRTKWRIGLEMLDQAGSGVCLPSGGGRCRLRSGDGIPAGTGKTRLPLRHGNHPGNHGLDRAGGLPSLRLTRVTDGRPKATALCPSPSKSSRWRGSCRRMPGRTSPGGKAQKDRCVAVSRPFASSPPSVILTARLQSRSFGCSSNGRGPSLTHKILVLQSA